MNSSYYVELNRPGEDGLSIPIEDFRSIAAAARTCGAAVAMRCPTEGEDSIPITAEQAQALADSLDNGLTANNLADVWTHFGEHAVEMIREFIAFLRRGAFIVVRTPY